MQARQKRLSTHCWTMKSLKVRILDYLRKWLGDKLEEMPPCAQHSLLTSIGWRVAIGAKRDHFGPRFLRTRCRCQARPVSRKFAANAIQGGFDCIALLRLSNGCRDRRSDHAIPPAGASNPRPKIAVVVVVVVVAARPGSCLRCNIRSRRGFQSRLGVVGDNRSEPHRPYRRRFTGGLNALQ
jgi:hypothetical protein